MWHFRRLLAVILGLFMVNGAFLASIYQHKRIVNLVSHDDDDDDDSFIAWGQGFVSHENEKDEKDEISGWMSPGRVLIEETRKVIEEAGGVPGALLSSSESQVWHSSHPCTSRLQLLRLWRRQKRAVPVADEAAESEPSGLLQALFQEYSNLHRTCTHGGNVAYVTNLYQSRNESGPCKFLVVEFGAYGVGNRLLWLISGYLYALLTKRVLLIDTRSTVDSLLCEPFPGSSWLLPEEFPYSSAKRWSMPFNFVGEWDSWERGLVNNIVSNKDETRDGKNPQQEGLKDLTMEEIRKEKIEMSAFIHSKIATMNGGNSGTTVKLGMERIVVARRLKSQEEPRPMPSFYEVQANDGWAPNPRFFCDNEQEHLDLVRWISLSSGCLYFLPGLFALPSFQPALEELFPNRDPLTHLLRQVMLPIDSVWNDVHHLYRTEFKTASKVVGIQVRYRDGAGMYNTLNNLVNDRITRCAKDQDILPAPIGTKIPAKDPKNGPVLVFIASLYVGLRKHLEKVYSKTIQESKSSRNPTFKLLQLSSAGLQSFDLDADYQAFGEIIGLSLSDELMTSPQSTYGQIAQAYGGLTPWVIDFEDSKESSDCVRGQSTDACYQFPIVELSCPFNKEVDGKAMRDVASYLKPCQDFDGLQLVPPWSSSLLSSNSTLVTH